MSKASRWHIDRRLARLLLIDAVIALLGMGTLMGFVAADQHDYGSIPHEFGVPAPREGDTFAYRTQMRPSLPEGASEASNLTLWFRWLSPVPLLDADGSRAMANRLVVQYRDEDWPSLFPPQTVLVYTEVGTGRYLGLGNQHGTTIRTRTDALGETERENSFRTFSEFASLRGNASEPGRRGCGLQNRLQEGPLDIHRAVALAPVCGFFWALPGAPDGPDLFRPIARRLLDGKEAIQFSREGILPKANVWFREDIPYPTLVAVEEPRQAWTFTALLTHFERGTIELPRRAGDSTELVAPVRWTNASARGPSEAGIEMPFTLAAAYERASGTGELASFLARAPDAFIEAANLAEWTRNDVVSRKWWFQVTDGRLRLLVGLVEERDVQGSSSSLLPPTSPPVRYRYENNTDHDPGAGRHAPNPKSAPPTDPLARAPEVASLLAQWRIRSGNASLAPNTWGFSLQSIGPDEGTTVVISVGARVSVERTGSPPDMRSELRSETHVMRFEVERLDSPPRVSFDQSPSPKISDALSAVVAVNGLDAEEPIVHKGPASIWRPPTGPYSIVVGLAVAGAMAWSWWREAARRRGKQAAGNKP